MSRIFALALTLALFGCADEAPWEEPPPAALAVVASVSAKEVRVLEPFEVVVDCYRRGDLPASFEPAIPAGSAGKVAVGAERAMGNGFWRRARLSLRATAEPGELTIGPFTAQSEDKTASAASDELTIRVLPALAPDSDADIEAPSPLLESKALSSWQIAGLVLALAAAAAGAGYWISTRGIVAPPRPSPPSEPPSVVALRKLALWRAASRRTPPEVDAFYVGCSDALRAYLEGRFGLRAPERTTEEFLVEAEQGGKLTFEHRATLKAFLSHCDLVKFAMHAPSEAQHLDALAIAEGFVRATGDTEPPPLPQGVRS